MPADALLGPNYDLDPLTTCIFIDIHRARVMAHIDAHLGQSIKGRLEVFYQRTLSN